MYYCDFRRFRYVSNICKDYHADHPTAKGLEHGLEYLKIAEMDFEALEMYRSLEDVLYYKALMLETLGRKDERDAACEKHEQIQTLQQQLATVSVVAEVSEICDAIVLIGAAISRR